MPRRANEVRNRFFFANFRENFRDRRESVVRAESVDLSDRVPPPPDFWEKHFDFIYCREPELRDPVSELRRPQYLATGNPPIVSAFGDTVWGGGAVLIISKNLPLKGKFFEMVSLRGLEWLCPSQESPLPVPCPPFGLVWFGANWAHSPVGCRPW